MKLLSAALAMAITLTACATAPGDFYKNPGKAKTTGLCRSLSETSDPVFQRDAAAELVRRGMTAQTCQDKINAENGIVAVIAIVGGAAVIGAASAGGSGLPGGGYQSANRDVDCLGGSGDGPDYQNGPLVVGNYDPNRLDANHNGIGCEASDRAYGS